MAALDTPEVSGDAVLLIAGIGVAAMILMAAFLTFLYYRDRAEDERSKPSMDASPILRRVPPAPLVVRPHMAN